MTHANSQAPGPHSVHRSWHISMQMHGGLLCDYIRERIRSGLSTASAFQASMTNMFCVQLLCKVSET